MSTQSLPSIVRGAPEASFEALCRCDDRRWRAHHDRLLLVESDADELLELLELAVTWAELDYSATAVVPPERWAAFAGAHTWRDPEWIERLFGLAADIALRPAPCPIGAVLDVVGR